MPETFHPLIDSDVQELKNTIIITICIQYKSWYMATVSFVEGKLNEYCHVHTMSRMKYFAIIGQVMSLLRNHFDILFLR